MSLYYSQVTSGQNFIFLQTCSWGDKIPLHSRGTNRMSLLLVFLDDMVWFICGEMTKFLYYLSQKIYLFIFRNLRSFTFFKNSFYVTVIFWLNLIYNSVKYYFIINSFCAYKFIYFWQIFNIGLLIFLVQFTEIPLTCYFIPKYNLRFKRCVLKVLLFFEILQFIIQCNVQ